MPPINLRTRQTIDFIEINEDVDMNGNKAVNAEDADAPQDLATKKQLDEKAEQLAQLLNWKATQW